MGEIIEAISDGRWIIKSYYMNAKIAVMYNLVKYIARKHTILVIDEKKIAIKYLTRNLTDTEAENIIITDKPVTSGIPVRNIVFFEPDTREYLKSENKNTVVFTTPGKHKTPRYYRKAYITRYGEEYVFKTPILEYRFKINGLEIKPVKLYGIYEKAYNTLREAVMEYGELEIRDAVFLLVHELGIDKEKARKILSDLAAKKYISVKNKIVEIR